MKRRSFSRPRRSSAPREPHYWHRFSVNQGAAPGTQVTQVLLDPIQLNPLTEDSRVTSLRIRLDFKPWVADNGGVALATSTPLWVHWGVAVVDSNVAAFPDPSLINTLSRSWDWMALGTWEPDISPGLVPDALGFANQAKSIDVKSKRKLTDSEQLIFTWISLFGTPVAGGSLPSVVIQARLVSSVLWMRTLR